VGLTKEGKNVKTDSFTRLVQLHQQLTRAGEGSLRAAHEFGGVVNELHDTGYSYAVLGEAVGLTGNGIGTYARLFRKYSSVHLLLEVSRAVGTYDVGRLASDSEIAHYAYAFRCTDCGSDKVRRERVPEVPASAEVEAHQAAEA
jgi:hypothetical protein